MANRRIGRHTNRTISINYNLPEDVIFEILSRLPVKPLIRFKLVCKSWLDLMSNPIFIQAHLTRTSLNPDNNSLIPSRQSFLINFSRIKSSKTVVNLHHRVPKICVLSNICLVGSINGLVCFYESTVPPGKIILWNPATKQFKEIPPPGSESGRIWRFSIGFGYDAVTSDFRIVHIVSYSMPLHKNTELFRVEVYSCNTDTWKKVTDTVSPLFVNGIEFNYDRRCDVIVKGTPYWDARSIMTLPRLVLAFDIHNEVFKQFQIPDYPVALWSVLDLINWMDNLAAIVHSYGETLKNRVRVYTLNQSCDTWTEMYNIQILDEVYEMPDKMYKISLCFKNGHVIVDDNYGKLLLFDPKNRDYSKKIRHLKPSHHAPFFDVVRYTESLVYIKGMEQVPDDNKKRKNGSYSGLWNYKKLLKLF